MSGNDGGTIRLSVPEAARHLGISERAVRKRIEAGTLPAERDGSKWIVTVPITAEEAVPSEEVVEAVYQVTPEQITQAIEQTGAKYMTDLETIFDRVGAIYEARLADKDAIIAELRKQVELLESQQPEPRESWWRRFF